MLPLLVLSVAQARPTEADAERYLRWYAAGERDRLWEAASPRYRSQHCLGDPAQCPQLDDVVLGQRLRARMSCHETRRRCTYTRTDRYDAPPLARSEATEIDWIVTTDLDGRFEGVARDPREPDAQVRVVGTLLGLACAVGTSFALVWGALVVLLQLGTPPDGER